MEKPSSNLSIYLIIVIFLLIFFMNFSLRGKITNLSSCEGVYDIYSADITTLVYRDGSTEFLTDYCAGNTLYEFFCLNNNEMRSTKLFCPAGCIEGMCFNSEEEKLQILGFVAGRQPTIIELSPVSPSSSQQKKPSTIDQSSTRDQESTGATLDEQETIIKLIEIPKNRDLTEDEVRKILESLSRESRLTEGTRDESIESYIQGSLRNVIRTTQAPALRISATQTGDRIVIELGDIKLIISGQGLNLRLN